MWSVCSFLKDFSDLILQCLLGCKQQDMQNALKMIKESYSALIHSHVRTWLVKNENATVSLPIFMITFPHVCKLVHRLFWEEVFPNTTVLLLSMSIRHNSPWSGRGARDTWCSGSKAQFARCSLSAQHCFNFLFSMLLAGERKRVWWYNRG